MITVLFVDDEVQLTKLYAAGLKNKFKILTANSAFEALDLLKEHSVEVLISDINMPKMNGCELAQEVEKNYPHIKRIAISADFKKPEHNELFSLFLEKPVRFQDIESAITTVYPN